jgi:AcrR family transcriptional regulator
MALRFVNKKRTAGERAGMDRPTILEAALSLWLKDGPTGCSIRAIAADLGVSPTTIHSHFKGGVDELREELARAALEEQAPPYKPGQDPKDYLRRLFRSLLASCRQKPHLGDLILRGLTKDPLFNPIFAERLCATVAAIAEKQPLASTLQIALCRLAGMIIIETSDWAFLEPEAAKEQLKGLISALPGAQFPTLKGAGPKLAATADARSRAGYAEKMGYATADALIYELQKGGK